MVVFIHDMEILKKYKPLHYEYYLSKIDKYLGNHDNVESWIKEMGEADLLVWLQILHHLKSNNMVYFEQSSKLLTLLIRLFMLELNAEIDKIELTNSQIKSLVNRFEHIVTWEYGYRCEIKKERIEYTLLKDVK